MVGLAVGAGVGVSVAGLLVTVGGSGVCVAEAAGSRLVGAFARTALEPGPERPGRLKPASLPVTYR
jgi:hypothetical protein